MAGTYWLSDRAWSAIEPLLPRNQPGARRVDDKWVISGIVHVLKSGCRWKDCPAAYGPPTTVYNRFNRWSRRGLWGRWCCPRLTGHLGGLMGASELARRAHPKP